MDEAEPGIWQLPERLTLDTVGALFRERGSQPGAIRGFDLSAVAQIDSAGVALLHWFRARQRELGLLPATIHGDAAQRYLALCRAHRIDEAEPA